ncbi:MAG: C69 family dipeptidase [Candidatus Zixiibacteriota bacterium]
MKQSQMIIILVLCSFFLFGLASSNECFSVIVGKDASANGFVMLAHTEDFDPVQNIDFRKYSQGEAFLSEDAIPEVYRGSDSISERFIVSVPTEKFSDCIMNEYGVIVASDQCPSRQDNPEVVDGGIDKALRHLVGERAVSARAGVHLAGEIVERVGYASNGRTYMICDPQEGWVFCAIGGRHWLAARVPDDEVAVIANSFTVNAVNFDDTTRFLASIGLTEYAAGRGWYDSETDSDFVFRHVFADSSAAVNSANVCRQWSGFRWLREDTVRADWKNLPFSMKPDTKIDISALMHIMGDHYEDSKLFVLPSDSSNPHENKFWAICNPITKLSFIAELRADMPKDIGMVYWLCLGRPCTSFYVPFYFGMDEIPEFYRLRPIDESAYGSTDIASLPDSLLHNEAFETFYNYCLWVDSNYASVADEAAKAKAAYYKDIFSTRDIRERQIDLYSGSDNLMKSKIEAITRYCIDAALDAIDKVKSK